jgi:endoglucanase
LLVLVLSMLESPGSCNQGPWSLWSSYSARFIDGQGRVIDPQGGDRSTSEGQSYALFFALVDNDRASFDRLLNWTQSNMASGDLTTHLPGWLWGKDKDGQWKLLDANSASDADVWMAYTLVEAGRLWKQPVYTRLGRQMMARIAKLEVADLPGFGVMLLPAPMGFQHQKSWTLNPSYLPLFIFERLAVLDSKEPWKQIALRIPRLLQESSRQGFAMDWVEYLPGEGFHPAPSNPEAWQPGKEGEFTGGSYDAIRVYLWAGMLNSEDRKRAEILNALPAMSAYLVDHDSPPEKISVQGVPVVQDGPVGFSAAVLPYLRALPHMEKSSARQEARLSAQKDLKSGLYGREQSYYDQNLALFATGYLEGRFRFGPSGELEVDWAHS